MIQIGPDAGAARVAEAWVARRPQGVARRVVTASADSSAGTATDAGPAAAQGVARRVVTASRGPSILDGQHDPRPAALLEARP
eukprot:scaffold37443_cov62-Phaeocystis_antarctica.AAC.2